MTETLRIAEIKVGERCRTDLGEIKDLAESIEAIGLLHPVVVTGAGELVAGERRLAALRSLNWDQIPVTVVDIDNAADVLRAELEENTCRRSLSAYEADVLREKRERVLAEDARRRQREAAARGGRTEGSPKLGEPSDELLPGMPEDQRAVLGALPERRTTKVAAIGTGYSGSTLDKVRTIRDAAERGVIKQGRTEIPAPEPVREAARAAVENIKKTGAAVDRSAAEVRDAIERHAPAPAKAKEALAGWRAKFQGAVTRITKVFGEFTPEQAAEKADDALITELRRAHGDLGDFIQRVETIRQADSNGLRLVQGGER